MKSLFFIFYISIFNYSFSQNLLANGGFEDENICMEFHVNCSPEAWISTSDAYNNFFKAQGIAHSGQHCVAIEAGRSKKNFNRSYIRTQLLCRLHKDKKYRIEFYIKSKYSLLDSNGIYFTPYDFLFEKRILYGIVPSMYLANATLRPENGDTGWQKVTIDYVATGKESFLTFGNFSKRDVNGSTGVPLDNNFLVFLDDVSLVPEDPNEKICSGWQKVKDDIYSFDARHQFLDRYVKLYKRNPPEIPNGGQTILLKVDTLIFPDVLFAVNKSELNEKSFHMIDSVCSFLQNKQIDSLVVEGYTDSTGGESYNQKLSKNRAASVANYIRQKLLLRPQLFVIRGMGSEKPLGNNETEEGRELNRRVEMFIYTSQ